MTLVMCSITDKNMPVMLQYYFHKKGKNVLDFPNYAKNVQAKSIKAYPSPPQSFQANYKIALSKHFDKDLTGI